VLGLLILLFLVVPIAELYVIVQVTHGIGVLNTIALLIVVGAVGGWLAKREGLALLRRLQAQLNRGQMPAKEVVDGALILLAGALMLTPGFLSDVLAIVLLVPPSRALVRSVVLRRFRDRIVVRSTGFQPPGGAQRAADPILEADSWEE
jgi:UPF0716 protein FxsA